MQNRLSEEYCLESDLGKYWIFHVLWKSRVRIQPVVLWDGAGETCLYPVIGLRQLLARGGAVVLDE